MCLEVIGYSFQWLYGVMGHIPFLKRIFEPQGSREELWMHYKWQHSFSLIELYEFWGTRVEVGSVYLSL